MHDPLLYTLRQYGGHGNVKPIVYWNRFKNTVERRIEMYTNRLMETTLPSAPWVRFLKILLGMIPVHALLEIPSTGSRYAAMMLDVAARIDDYLAPNYMIKTRANLFVSDNNSTVQEYLIPCRSETPLLDLPLGDEIQFWKSVHPVRILYSDTIELCGNFYHGDFEYKQLPPKQMIIAIDTPSLIFKYIAYCDFQIKHKESISMTQFIQRHIVSTLYYDVFNCWIFQVLNMFICDMSKSNPDALRAQLVVHPNIVTDILTKQATEDICTYWTNLTTLRYNLDDFMIANWFSSHGWMTFGTDLNSMVFDFEHYVQMPMLRQNAYIRFMTDFPLVRLVVMVNNLLRTSIGRKMNKELNIILTRLKMANILINCQNTSLQDKLSKQLDEVIAISQRDDSFPREAEPRTFEF